MSHFSSPGPEETGRWSCLFCFRKQACLISITWAPGTGLIPGRQYPPPIPFYLWFRHSRPIHLSPLLNVFSFPGKQSPMPALIHLPVGGQVTGASDAGVWGWHSATQRLQNKGSPSAFEAVKCQAWLERSLVLTALCASRRAAFLLGTYLIALPVVGALPAHSLSPLQWKRLHPPPSPCRTWRGKKKKAKDCKILQKPSSSLI